MSPLTAILLLVFGASPDAAPAASRKSTILAESHYPGAAEVAAWKFEPTRDEEVYGWPQGWTRRHGPGFPRYVQVRVDDDRPPPGGRCLHVDLNGGAASAFGPTIAIEPGVDYVLEGFVKTSALEHDAAWLSLTFLDSARLKLTCPTSARISGTSGWQKVRIGPLAPPAGASSLIVGINVAPRGDAQDLRGAAAFGSLWLGRVPRVVLTARPVENKLSGSTRGAGDASFHVFARGKPIEIACLVTGFNVDSSVPKYEVRLTLEDAAGRKLAQHTQTFATASATTAQAAAKGKTGGAEAPIELGADNAARSTWQIPSESVGFYRIHAQVIPLSLREKAEVRADELVRQGFTSSSTLTKPSPPALLPMGVGSISASTPQATLGLAFVDPESPPANSEFGWSLDPQDAALGLVPLGDLLTQAGVRSVKFPFACSFDVKPIPAAQSAAKPPAALPATAHEPDRIEPLIGFSDRLASAGVRLIGEMLPPPVTEATGQTKLKLLTVEAFARDAKTWFPSIEPVLARLATEIRFWQIGGDRDRSWTGCSDHSAVLTRVKSALDQIGQDLNVGVAWNLAAPLPVDSRSPASAGVPPLGGNAGRVPPKGGTPARAKRAPWSFLSLACDDAMSDAELAARLDATKSAGVQRWLAIDALPQTGHSGDERIAHLVGRMIAAKMHGADGIFFARPFDSERGLVGRDGSPGELFLPWRTTALTLGGATYAGDIDLAGGSRIHCFGDNGKYVGVLTGDASRQETVYLGNDLRCRDLWGRITDCRPTMERELRSESAVQHVGWTSESISPPATSPAPRSLVNVQRLPVFLTGMDGPITEWQLNVAFAPRSLPSVPLTEAAVALEMKNTLPRAVNGRVRITPPRNWHVEPETAEFRIEPGAAWKLPLKVALPNDVLAGRQMVALEFEIQSDRFDHFTMYRPIEVTLGDVAMDARAALTEQGDLEVRQTLSNQGKRAVGFRCDLIAPDRRRQSTEIILLPGAKSDFAYRLPDGRELLGKPLWLRAEEINGPRMLNYRLEMPAGK
jgi:hypothetical protein